MNSKESAATTEFRGNKKDHQRNKEQNSTSLFTIRERTARQNCFTYIVQKDMKTKHLKQRISIALSVILVASSFFSDGKTLHFTSYAAVKEDILENNIKVATAGNADRISEQNDLASSSDALVDEDGFLLDGVVSNNLEIINDIVEEEDLKKATVSTADRIDPMVVIKESVVDLSDFEEEDSDTLLMKYLEKEAVGKNDEHLSMMKQSSYLTLLERRLLSELRMRVNDVASGEASSTRFEIPLELLLMHENEFPEEMMGLSGPVYIYDEDEDTFFEDEDVLEEARTWMSNRIKYDFDEICSRLCTECSYELYWSDNHIYSEEIKLRHYEVRNGNQCDAIFCFEPEYLVVKFGVGAGYRVTDDDPFCIDTEKTKAASHAAEKAHEIVDTAAALPDYEKLVYYKNTICELTEYNHEAADSEGAEDYGSIDPWSVISVFDEDTSTKAVCSGYACAFHFLCRITSFNENVSCIFVTGDIETEDSVGSHVWNIVTMEDNLNYLVDVTNCDSDSAGYPDKLFLRGTNVGGIEEGYGFKVTSGIVWENIYYKYDEETLEWFEKDQLSIAGTDYQYDPELGRGTISGTNIKWIVTEKEGELSLVIKGNGNIPAYEESAEKPWNDYASEIKHITIEEGIKTVGEYAFSAMPEVQDVSLPTSLNQTQKKAFCNCNKLHEIKNINPLMTVSDDIFMGDSLQVIRFSGTETQWKNMFLNVILPDQTKIYFSDDTVKTVSELRTETVIQLSGDGTNESPYLISTAEELRSFAYQVSNNLNYMSSVIRLTDDIYLNDLSDYERWSVAYAPQNIWKGISGFKGSFYGNGNTIYGLYMNNAEDYTGFFRQLDNTSETNIRDLNLESVFISGTNYVGAIAGEAKDIKIEYCTVNGKVQGTGHHVAGFLGQSGSRSHYGTIILNSTNYANVVGYTYTAGFIGEAYIGNSSGIGWENVGGNGMLVLENCENHGDIGSYGRGQYVGGIAGDAARSMNCGGSLISRLTNTGTVQGSNYVGGIFGRFYSWKGSRGTEDRPEFCLNEGRVRGYSYVGGIIGLTQSDGNDPKLLNSYNTGTIEGLTYSGGIAGYNREGFVVSKCFNIGEVSGRNYAGGTIGYNPGGIENLFTLDGTCSSPGPGISLTAVAMRIQESFTGYDFQNVWKMGDDCPVFREPWEMNSSPIHYTEEEKAQMLTAYLEELPVLDEDDAKNFLAFIYNKGPGEVAEADFEENEFYQLLTGNYASFDSVEEVKSLIISNSALIRYAIDQQTTDSSDKRLYLSGELLSYFAGEYQGQIEGYFKDSFVDAVSTWVSNTGGTDKTVLKKAINNIKWSVSSFLTLYSKIEETEEFIDNCIAAIEILHYELSSEVAGRTMYFSSYLGARSGWDKDDDVFKLIMDNNALACADGNMGFGILWIGNNEPWIMHREEIDRWAETLYQLEQSVLLDSELNESVQPVSIQVMKNIVYGGMVSGQGTYHTGDTAVIIARPAENYEFIRWTSNGVEVSRDSAYSFVVQDNAVYMAEFASSLDVIPVTGIHISKNELTLEKGTEEKLSAAVWPVDATNKGIIWQSNDPEIVNVSESGLVTAKKGGETVITAVAEDGGFQAICNITVHASVESVTLDKNILTIDKGKKEQLNAWVQPEDASNKNLIWFTMDDEIASVTSEGIVEALSAGNTRIIVRSEEGGFSDYCDVTIAVPVEKVILSDAVLKITEDQEYDLTAVIEPEDASNKNVTWSSSNTAVASVDQNGKVTAVKAGTARITVKTADGNKTAVCTVTVEAKDAVEAFVRRLYIVCLDREADAGGLQNWLGKVKSGNVKGIQLAYSFIFSDEFKSKNYCDKHFVIYLYRALMGREPDTAGLSHWEGLLKNGTRRETLLNQFASSDEYRKLCSEAGIEPGASISVPKYGVQPYGACAVCGEKTKVVQFVERAYRECMGREADTGGLKYWSKSLYEHTATGKSLVRNFVLSSEMRNKNLSNKEYIKVVYRVMLGREADNGGLNYWQSQMESGKKIEDIIDGFVDSSEFKKICSDYGIQRK